MEETISVEAVLQRASSYDGQVVSVDGQFIAAYAGSFICAHSEALEITPDRPRIRLESPDLVDRCFQVASPYTGGPWYYHDPATVRGRFFARPEPRIVEIVSLVIHRAERDHQVQL